MSPLELEAQYHSLKVILDDLKTTNVDVRRYQNNDAAFKTNVNWGNAAALVQKDNLLGKIMDDISVEKKAVKPVAKLDPKTPADSPKAIENENRRTGNLVHLANAEILRRTIGMLMPVHTGKGSPEEIATVLHLVAVYKLYDKKFGDDSAGGVREYCDKYVGLDCNGFVNNYGKLIGLPKTRDTPIGSYATAKDRRGALADVKANDVLVWTDHSHINVIDSIGMMPSDATAGRDCVIVESSAHNPSGATATANGGLQHSTYCIRSVDPKTKIFTVERPKGGEKVNVYIGPIG